MQIKLLHDLVEELAGVGTGRIVEILTDQNLEAGYHSAVWNADSYSSGVYFVKMVAGEFVNTQKLMLVK